MIPFLAFAWQSITLHLYADGSLFVPDYKLLVLSDLHLEKGAAQSHTVPLPNYDTPDTLLRMEQAIKRTQPDSCILLGDSFHNSEVAWRLPETQLSHLDMLSNLCDLHWVEGNHDPNLPQHVPGYHTSEIAVGPIEFRHMPMDGHKPNMEIIGHFHPKARVKLRARQLSGKCFFQNKNRLIMPAFGSFTGGLNILDKAIKSLMPKAEHVFFCHQSKIYQFPYKAQNFMTNIV